MTDQLDAKLSAHPEHDQAIHGPDSDLFYMACRRCSLLERLRARDWPLPGRREVEAYALVLYGRPGAARRFAGLSALALDTRDAAPDAAPEGSERPDRA